MSESFWRGFWDGLSLRRLLAKPRYSLKGLRVEGNGTITRYNMAEVVQAHLRKQPHNPTPTKEQRSE